MSPSQIVCPKCRTKLNKPPQLAALSEISGAGGNFIAFGDPDDTVVCPACGWRIRIGDIIEGKHDDSVSPGSAIVGLLLLVGFVAWLVHACSG